MASAYGWVFFPLSHCEWFLICLLKRQRDTVFVVPTMGILPVLKQSSVWMTREEEISECCQLQSFTEFIPSLFPDVFAQVSQCERCRYWCGGALWGLAECAVSVWWGEGAAVLSVAAGQRRGGLCGRGALCKAHGVCFEGLVCPSCCWDQAPLGGKSRGGTNAGLEWASPLLHRAVGGLSPPRSPPPVPGLC